MKRSDRLLGRDAPGEWFGDRNGADEVLPPEYYDDMDGELRVCGSVPPNPPPSLSLRGLPSACVVVSCLAIGDVVGGICVAWDKEEDTLVSEKGSGSARDEVDEYKMAIDMMADTTTTAMARLGDLNFFSDDSVWRFNL